MRLSCELQDVLNLLEGGSVLPTAALFLDLVDQVCDLASLPLLIRISPLNLHRLLLPARLPCEKPLIDG